MRLRHQNKPLDIHKILILTCVLIPHILFTSIFCSDSIGEVEILSDILKPNETLEPQLDPDDDDSHTLVVPEPEPPVVHHIHRTFISDIIGLSALKFMFIFLFPMVFSAFLGALLVLISPFPLITSTAGLAGGAAIGRRKGRENINQDDQYYNLNDQKIPQGIHIPNIPIPPLEEIETPIRKRKILKRKSKKVRMMNDDDFCLQRIACEIGKENRDPNSKELVNKLIQHLSQSGDSLKWNSLIHAYMDGIHFQEGTLMVIATDSNNNMENNENHGFVPPIMPQGLEASNLVGSSPHPRINNPVYSYPNNININNPCSQYRCSM